MQKYGFHVQTDFHVIRNESRAVPQFDLETFIPYQLSVLANRVSHSFSQCYGKSFGLTIPQWRVMAHLSRHQKISIREIYRKVEMDKSKVSRAATQLERAGYVTKAANKSDLRLIELSLTPRGWEVFEAISQMAIVFDENLLSQLDDALAPVFQRAMQTLLKAKEDNETV